jgi:hypothetical protein
MAVYIWPPDNKEVKTRVVTAMGLLVSAKVMLYGIVRCTLYTVQYTKSSAFRNTTTAYVTGTYGIVRRIQNIFLFK